MNEVLVIVVLFSSSLSLSLHGLSTWSSWSDAVGPSRCGAPLPFDKRVLILPSASSSHNLACLDSLSRSESQGVDAEYEEEEEDEEVVMVEEEEEEEVVVLMVMEGALISSSSSFFFPH